MPHSGGVVKADVRGVAVHLVRLVDAVDVIEANLALPHIAVKLVVDAGAVAWQRAGPDPGVVLVGDSPQPRSSRPPTRPFACSLDLRQLNFVVYASCTQSDIWW